jgi:hypothetical protein
LVTVVVPAREVAVAGGAVRPAATVAVRVTVTGAGVRVVTLVDRGAVLVTVAGCRPVTVTRVGAVVVGSMVAVAVGVEVGGGLGTDDSASAVLGSGARLAVVIGTVTGAAEEPEHPVKEIPPSAAALSTTATARQVLPRRVTMPP